LRPPIVLRLRDSEGEAGYLQELAGESFWSAQPILAGARPAPRPERPRGTPDAAPRVVYDGPGLVEGRIQRIVSEVSSDGTRRVTFEDGERFEIDAGGSAIVRVAGSAVPEAAGRCLERALGAPLALALAPRGVYLLHASALVLADTALALSAPSGGGKSTLAAAGFRAGMDRLADDQLPVRLDGAPAALPHFPQLKLAAAEGRGARGPREIPLGALVELAHSPAHREARIEPLSAAGGALALTRATVAARLFDEPLLAAHFAACAEAAERMTVARLTYPSGLHRLPEALAVLADLAHELL